MINDNFEKRVVLFLCLSVCTIGTFAQHAKPYIKPPTNPDFKAGEEIVLFDDFSNCDLGLVPKNWEVVPFHSKLHKDSSKSGAGVFKTLGVFALRTPGGLFSEYLRSCQ